MMWCSVIKVTAKLPFPSNLHFHSPPFLFFLFLFFFFSFLSLFYPSFFLFSLFFILLPSTPPAPTPLHPPPLFLLPLLPLPLILLPNLIIPFPSPASELPRSHPQNLTLPLEFNTPFALEDIWLWSQSDKIFLLDGKWRWFTLSLKVWQQ